MSAWYVWGAIALLTLSTIITRCAFFLFGHTVKLPERVKHALRYAPTAALSAIVIPDLVMDVSGLADFNLANPKLLAGIGGAIFFAVTRHLLGTIVAGMALFTVLRLVL